MSNFTQKYPEDTLMVTERILNLILARRRGFPNEPARTSPSALAAPIQFTQVMAFVLLDQPIKMTLPAFPCKSPSPAKVAGSLPDEGERLALTELNELCQRIGRFYPPGAGVTICSDGHVFGDHIGVDDVTITAYNAEIRSLIGAQQLHRLTVFDLQNLWPERSFSQKRALLDAAWCEPPAILRTRARRDAALAQLVAGMTKFLFEDLSFSATVTRSQRQKMAKRRAYLILSRSQGWARIVSAHFPRHLRLSIHPQPWGTEKLGIRLLNHADPWTTPWHSVVLYSPDGRPNLVRHHDARTIGVPQFCAGRLTHYVVS